MTHHSPLFQNPLCRYRAGRPCQGHRPISWLTLDFSLSPHPIPQQILLAMPCRHVQDLTLFHGVLPPPSPRSPLSQAPCNDLLVGSPVATSFPVVCCQCHSQRVQNVSLMMSFLGCKCPYASLPSQRRSQGDCRDTEACPPA